MASSCSQTGLSNSPRTQLHTHLLSSRRHDCNKACSTIQYRVSRCFMQSLPTGHSFNNLERKQVEAHFLWNRLLDFLMRSHTAVVLKSQWKAYLFKTVYHLDSPAQLIHFLSCSGWFALCSGDCPLIPPMLCFVLKHAHTHVQTYKPRPFFLLLYLLSACF